MGHRAAVVTKAAACLSAILGFTLVFHSGCTYPDSIREEWEPKVFLDEYDLALVVHTGTASRGRLILLLERDITEGYAETGCDAQRAFVNDLHSFWNRGVKSRRTRGPVRQVMILSYTGHELISYKHGLFWDTYHCE